MFGTVCPRQCVRRVAQWLLPGPLRRAHLGRDGHGDVAICEAALRVIGGLGLGLGVGVGVGLGLGLGLGLEQSSSDICTSACAEPVRMSA